MRPLLGIFRAWLNLRSTVPLRLFMHLWMILQEVPKPKMMLWESYRKSMLEKLAAKVGCSCCPSSCPAGRILRLFGQSIHQLLARWDFHFQTLEKHCEVPWSFLSGKALWQESELPALPAVLWCLGLRILDRLWTFIGFFFSFTELNFETFRPVSRHLDRCWLCFFGPSGWSPASEWRSSSGGTKVLKWNEMMKWMISALNSPISIWSPGLACLVSTSADTVNCINATEETHLWCVPGDQVWSC